LMVFWSPSFQPEKFDDKSLFLLLHLSSLTDFVNYPNWSTPVSPLLFFREIGYQAYLPELCFMVLEIRIPVRSRAYRDGSRGTFWTPCTSPRISRSHIDSPLKESTSSDVTTTMENRH
jgi:hypothetical protein